jgi:hypothetical protein
VRVLTELTKPMSALVSSLPSARHARKISASPYSCSRRPVEHTSSRPRTPQRL